MKILIAEDDDNFLILLQRIVRPVRVAFPASEVIIVKTFAAVLEAIEVEQPHITLLDLSFPDSNFEETLAQLGSIEEKTAVVIVTGHREELVRKIIGNVATPVVEKDAALFAPDILTKAIYIALLFFQKRKETRFRADMEILRSILPEHATV